MARILVVDDDPDILRIVEKVLRMHGHEVYTAHDAMKAMDMLNASLYDLLISDANMPLFSGFELVRSIKNNRRFSRMAVAMLTGLREKKDLEKAIRAGVDDYIVKPIEPALLMEKIEALFEKKPPMEQLDYRVPEGASYSQISITHAAQLTQISELGLTIRTKVEIPEGIAVQLASDLFKRLDIKPPAFKVISCRKLLEFDYEVRVAFVGATEYLQGKLRAWIHAQSSKKGAA